MAELLSVATALADHCVSAADTQRHLAGALSANAAARFIRMVQASGNETRYFALPFDDVRRLDALESRNRHYVIHAVRLGEAVAREAVRRAAVGMAEVDAVVGVSSTGYLMPTLETHLIERLGLSPRCRRVPLTQLGCAGGAAGLGLAAALCADPAMRVLVVSVELPSLSFPTAEPTPSDILAATQFGDGAAAAVVSGGELARGPQVVASGSMLFPETIERDGVHLTTAGLRLVRPRGLARVLERQLGGAVEEFLAPLGLVPHDLAFWIIHPRNPELLDAAAASLRLPDSALAASRTVWRRSGNLVSAAVFHVLRELRASAPPPDGALGLMVAFGAGFGCELVLLRAGGWLAGASDPARPAPASAAAPRRGVA